MAESEDRSEFADSTGSDKSLAIAKQWLQTCMKCHNGVCKPLAYEQLRLNPTRLIEIQEEGLYLRSFGVQDAVVPYLIFSYCWGKERFGELKLTRQDEEQMRAGIKFSDLPQTVADAIIVTRRLGYCYLWVDRFCIIQDDMDDWRFEANRMQSYYMMADCCIAALVSKDAHQGMYTRRNPLLMQSLFCQIPDTKKSIQVSVESIGGHMGHYPVLYRGPPYVLSERAWVFQERMLAPRTLYFGSLMLYWECRSARFAENHPDLDLDLPFAANLRKFGSRSAASSQNRLDSIVSNAAGEEDIWNNPTDQLTLNRFQDRWADIVEFFTKCEMTYPEKDRLMAITGIMNSVVSHTGQQFIHGMLSSCLPTELLWWQWVDCHGNESTRPIRIGHMTRTPTWSRASVQGRISPFWSHRFMLPQRRSPWRIEIKTTMEEFDPGAATWMTCMTTATGNAICRVEGESPLIEVQIGDRIDTRHYCWNVQAFLAADLETFITFQARMWPDEPVVKGQTVGLLRAATLEPSSDRSVCFAGLVIVPYDTQNLQYWRRIGYWHSQSGVYRVNNPTDEMRSVVLRTVDLGRQVGFAPIVQLL